MPFHVDISDGRIFTSDEVDYESDPIHYTFTVATWDASGHHQSSIEVTVNLLDVNEHIPIFTRPDSRITIDLDYDMPVGSELCMVMAEDRDKSSVYGRVAKYKIVSPLYFRKEYVLPITVEKSLWNVSGRLKLAAPLKEEHALWLTHVDVVAIDGGLFMSDPLRINFNFEQNNKIVPLNREVRQADVSLLNATTPHFSIELMYGDIVANFNSSLVQTRPLNISFPETSEPGEMRVTLELVPHHSFDESEQRTTVALGSGSTSKECDDDFYRKLFVLEQTNFSFRIETEGVACRHTLVNTEELDFENPNISLVYPLSIRALYDGYPLEHKAYLQVFLRDVNDHVPIFSQRSYSVTFPENFLGPILQAQASDQDGSLEFSELTYNLTGDTRFLVEGDGTVRCLVSFDYEQADPCYYFNVTASDAGGLMAIAPVEACLRDTNDNCPQFGQDEYQVSVEENTPANTVILNFTAVDYDSSSEFSSAVTFSIGPDSISQYFGVLGNASEFQGQLYLQRPLDYETDETSYSFQLLASDAPDSECSANVTVTLLNVRDVAPVFAGSFTQVSIPEEEFPYRSLLPENVIACIPAIDPEGDNITFSILNPSPYFTLVDNCVLLVEALDYETQSRYELEISASDGQTTSLQSYFVIVDVEDQNDLALKVQSTYRVDVPEAFYTSDPILNLTVRDPDRGVRYSYELEQFSELFHISQQGRIYLISQLDYETRISHVFTVIVTDGTALVISRVTVRVIPVNEHPPEFFTALDLERSMKEDDAPNEFQFVLNAIDRDRDSPDPITYRLEYLTVDGAAPPNSSVDGSNTTLPFSIVQPAPRSSLGMLVNSVILDYETDSRVYELRITASDGLYSSEPLLLTIMLEDVNDLPPVFPLDSYEFNVPEDQDNLELQIAASDGDGSFIYSLITSYTIDPIEPLDRALPFYVSSGVIRNTVRFDYENPPIEYKFYFIAEDDYGLSGRTNVTIHIEDANEYRPTFRFVYYQATILESAEVGSDVIEVTAEDRDGGPVFGNVSYSLVSSGEPLDVVPFRINETTGNVFLTDTVDFDIGQEGADFFVQATDGGGLSSQTRVFISIEDVNDNPPCPLETIFGTYVVENMYSNFPLRRIRAVDIDYYADNPRGLYYIEPPYEEFRIDNAGRLFMTRALDHEEKATYEFAVITSDGIRNCSEQTAITIHVLNADDNRPEFASLTYVFNISETTEPSGLFNVTAYDKDPPDYIVEYRLRTENVFFRLPFEVSNTGLVESLEKFDADDS